MAEATIEVAGRRGELLAPGETKWKALVVGTADLAKGSKVRLGAGTTAKLVVERDGATRAIELARNGEQPALYTYPPIGEARPGIWLIDMSRSEMTAIEAAGV